VALAAGTGRLAELAEATGASADGLARLLRAAATLGLVREPEPGRFELTDTGAELQANRDMMGFFGDPAMYLVHSRLADAVVLGRPVSRDVLGATMWEYLGSRPQEQAGFDRAMAMMTTAVTDAIVRTYDLSRFRRIVDVGGGRGARRPPPGRTAGHRRAL
jgi:multifunctional cyclase/dehydratase/O-methyltransferase